ncbi:acetylornithine deacetylase [Hyunsoonleella pacifica]|uniref:Acetylornithine deacetylase n=1 Tax=Hyunsoonleella pacifica TaxID=1080224 RepID=A0A4Q9FQ10_9FLAO|nr:acetylornithine deacetylase [Hyunsoonleella pacifica]TBN17420.1 acetylornithine deacetylase [Hyunsoonleella pacifica]GGD12098.1 acetylornithine deacetylase [Hyunsoonleella pacifica]
MTTEDILAKLVSFPVLGGDSNLSIIQWIKNYIESFGITCTLVPNKENTKASLHCRIGPAEDGGIILSGHTDVVPVEGQDWDTPPFTLTDKNDGKLYGRGTCDMKGFLACCLSMLPNLKEAKLKKPIYFAFSYDEEIGCLSAPELVAHLKNHYPETPKYAIIGEPSLLQPIIGHKGICLYTTSVNGSAGHSSRIKQEVSAIHEAAKLVLWLEDKMNAFVKHGNTDERFSPPYSSLHTGIIHGGIAPNVIADKAYISWDARMVPNDSLDEVIKEFKSHCKNRMLELKPIFPDFKIETEEIHPPVIPFDSKADSDIVKLMSKINSNENIGTVAYASEAGQYNEAGLQSIICGPGSIKQAHRANEFITKQELKNYEQLLKNLIELCSSDDIDILF